jgi:hypothetical protein
VGTPEQLVTVSSGEELPHGRAEAMSLEAAEREEEVEDMEEIDKEGEEEDEREVDRERVVRKS